MVNVILTHQNADFDAIASMLGAHKLYPDAKAVLPERINRNVEEFLTLYRSALPFVVWEDVAGEEIDHIILTDSQTSPFLGKIEKAQNEAIETLIIEHHELKRPLKPYEKWHYEKLGAITTWFVEQIRERDVRLAPLEATLLALGIYEDNGMLTYGGTTVRDVEAVAWLLRCGAVLDTVRRFLSHPLNDRQQALFEQLMDKAITRTIQGYSVTIASAKADEVISGINSVAGQLRDILDPTALFVLVEMPHAIQMVCRSRHDAVDVGLIAGYFKGGGHPRAAAATVYKQSLVELENALWEKLYSTIQPSVRVADLMSYGVQIVQEDAPIREIIQQLRRIGHEGYPVINAQGRVVGLLTLRDADRALEHGLNAIRVCDVMRGGEIWLRADDSVYALEQTMVRSGWGQIPIVDDGEVVIGIVTRTDLINHWAKTHPRDTDDFIEQGDYDMDVVLGKDVRNLTEIVTRHAQERGIALYLVGGIVRDLLLKRPNYDVDFVVEGDAIAFAQALVQIYGGRIHSYKPFGTAKWHLDETIAEALGLTWEGLPDHIDFATARSELYTHPTALPTVYHSGIKLDLRRRDFTINTLAIQLSPSSHHQRLHDYYGGMADLTMRLIRVLHSLSFVDDPTRILRAVRFSERLRFSIESRTQELILSGLPMLGRITGERVRNELTLLLQEERAKRGLQKLEALGALRAIHPVLSFGAHAVALWDAYHQNRHEDVTEDGVHGRWHVLMASVPHQEVRAVCRRLLFGQRDADLFYQTAYLLQEASYLRDVDAKPSAITGALDKMDERACEMALHLSDDGRVIERLSLFLSKWRNLRPHTNGHTLKAMGIPESPLYRDILMRLRQAWLDGDIHNREEEEALLKSLLPGE